MKQDSKQTYQPSPLLGGGRGEGPCILCIIGASGSGKTTIDKMLSRYWPNMFHRIVSHTTRPMREGEHDGDEHIFNFPELGEEIAKKYQDRVLAFTKYGEYYYWADHADLDANSINTYVIDVEGYHDLVKKWGSVYDIRVMYVKRPNKDGIDKDRRERDNGREQLIPDDVDITLCNEINNMDYLWLVTQAAVMQIIDNFNFPLLNAKDFKSLRARLNESNV